MLELKKALKIRLGPCHARSTKLRKERILKLVEIVYGQQLEFRMWLDLPKSRVLSLKIGLRIGILTLKSRRRKHLMTKCVMSSILT